MRRREGWEREGAVRGLSSVAATVIIAGGRPAYCNETSLRGVNILDVNERRGAKLRKNGRVSGSVVLESRRPDWMRGRSLVLTKIVQKNPST